MKNKMKKQKTNTKKRAIIIISILAGLFLFGLFLPDTEQTETNIEGEEIIEEFQRNDIQACYAAQEFVKDYLTNPRSADFENCYDVNIIYLEDSYFVHSFVESKNSYGVYGKTVYSVELKDNMDDSWTLKDIEIF